MLQTRALIGTTSADQRTEFAGRTATLAQPSRPVLDADMPTPPIAGDASGTTPAPDVILLKSGFKQVATRVREILYVESARNYVRIYLENGAVLKSRVPIDHLGRHLGNERFLRIHRGRLVNRERIRSVRSLTGGRLQLTLTQGSTIAVARDRRRAVLAEIGAVIERKSEQRTTR